MSKSIVSLFALTLFVPKAMAANKPAIVAGAYRRASGVRCHPNQTTVLVADGSVWTATRTTLQKEEGKVVRDEKGNPTEVVETVTIPAGTRSAMIREWRERALGLGARR